MGSGPLFEADELPCDSLELSVTHIILPSSIVTDLVSPSHKMELLLINELYNFSLLFHHL